MIRARRPPGALGTKSAGCNPRFPANGGCVWGINDDGGGGGTVDGCGGIDGGWFVGIGRSDDIWIDDDDDVGCSIGKNGDGGIDDDNAGL